MIGVSPNTVKKMSSSLLPKNNRIRVAVVDGNLTRAECTGLEHVIVVLPQRITAQTLQGVSLAATIKALRSRARDRSGILHGTLPGRQATGITVGTARDGADTFARLTLARQLIDDALRGNPASIGVLSLEKDPAARSATAAAIGAAALARGVDLPSFKTGRRTAAAGAAGPGGGARS